jgi:hypothetical protein
LGKVGPPCALRQAPLRPTAPWVAWASYRARLAPRSDTRRPLSTQSTLVDPVPDGPRGGLEAGALRDFSHSNHLRYPGRGGGPRGVDGPKPAPGTPAGLTGAFYGPAATYPAEARNPTQRVSQESWRASGHDGSINGDVGGPVAPCRKCPLTPLGTLAGRHRPPCAAICPMEPKGREASCHAQPTFGAAQQAQKSHSDPALGSGFRWTSYVGDRPAVRALQEVAATSRNEVPPSNHEARTHNASSFSQRAQCRDSPSRDGARASAAFTLYAGIGSRII